MRRRPVRPFDPPDGGQAASVRSGASSCSAPFDAVRRVNHRYAVVEDNTLETEVQAIQLSPCTPCADLPGIR